jgi:hypothetical protein
MQREGITYSRAPPFLLSYSLSCNALEVAISISSSFASSTPPALLYAGRTDESFYKPRVIIPSICLLFAFDKDLLDKRQAGRVCWRIGRYTKVVWQQQKQRDALHTESASRAIARHVWTPRQHMRYDGSVHTAV